MRILLVIVSFGWICANSLEVGFDDDFQMVLDGSLNSTTEEARYTFQVPPDALRDKAVVVTSNVVHEDQSSSGEMDAVLLHVNVRNRDGQLVWSHRRRQAGQAVTRTVFSQHRQDQPQPFGIYLTIMNNATIAFQVRVQLKDIRIAEEAVTFTVTDEAPAVWRVSLENEYFVRLLATSGDDVCATVALQRLQHPFATEEAEVVYKSDWQTMLGLSALDAHHTVFPGGFYVVVVVNTDQNKCWFDPHPETPLLRRSKNVTLQILTPEDSTVVVNGTIVVTGVYAGLFAVAVVLSLGFGAPIEGRRHLLSGYNRKIARKSSRNPVEPKGEPDEVDDVQIQAEAVPQPRVLSTTDFRSIECFYIEMNTVESPQDDVDGEVPDISGENQSLRLARYLRSAAESRSSRIVAKLNPSELNRKRRKEKPTLDDLSTKCDPYLFNSTLRAKSSLYAWIILISGVFYLLPAVQLMLANQAFARQAGNGDYCYYNFLCKAQLGMLEDYGHVFSNVSYIFCGAFFIVMTAIRRYKRHCDVIAQVTQCQTCDGNKSAAREEHECPKNAKLGRNVLFILRRGIPEQYGIFFALGAALIAEGLLSASYHVCPTNESFQFDTTFMYVIAILVFLKVFFNTPYGNWWLTEKKTCFN